MKFEENGIREKYEILQAKNRKGVYEEMIKDSQRTVINLLLQEGLIQDAVDEKSVCMGFRSAVENGRTDIIQLILQERLIPELEYESDLDNAIETGNLGIVVCLVEYGTPFYKWEQRGLSVAAIEGQLEIVEYLVEHGADVYGNTDALRGAIDRNHKEIVKYLVKHGANISDKFKLRHSNFL